MEGQCCVFLGIKVKPGPIERHKIENFTLENTVDTLKTEAEKKTNVPSDSLELVYHGRILKNGATLQDSGIKNGEMVHVVKKKERAHTEVAQIYTDADLQQIVTVLRSFGCMPNSPGWTRAMQLLNDDATMTEIVDAVPSLGEECVTLSILHEVELLAALGMTIHTLRRGADARPDLPAALRHLMRLVRARPATAPVASEAVPTSGFAYSLEALSEDEDADEEETEEVGERNQITQEQLAAALQAATAVSTSAPGSNVQPSLLRMLQGAGTSGEPRAAPAAGAAAPAASSSGSRRARITPEMFSEVLTEAFNRSNSAAARRTPAGTPMELSAAASSSQSPTAAQTEGFFVQLQHMHEMGLLNDTINVRALVICSGDVNAAINLVFSGAIGDD